MNLMNVRTFVKGGYLTAREPVTVIRGTEVLGTWTPAVGEGAARIPVLPGQVAAFDEDAAALAQRVVPAQREAEVPAVGGGSHPPAAASDTGQSGPPSRPGSERYDERPVMAAPKKRSGK